MRVLQVAHALPPDTYGGTELYTHHLAETLAADDDVAVAAPRGTDVDIPAVDVFSLPDVDDRPGPYTVVGPDGGVTCDAVERAFEDVLASFGPDLVHFQHLKRLSARLPALCAEYGAASVLTLHDFWTICHREQLYHPDGERCSGPDSVEKCTDCYVDALADGGTAPASAGADTTGEVDRSHLREEHVDAVRARTEHLEAALRSVDRLVSPSRFLRRRFVEYGTPPDHVVQIRNGIRVDRFDDTGYDPEEPTRIGYAGRIAETKGVHLLVEAFDAVSGDAELHAFGQFDPAENPYHAHLREMADDRVAFHGWYEDPTTPYAAADVVVLPSLWFENSPLVIQEAFAAGVPVVTADVGGMAELVADGEDGLTVPAQDADALAECLRRVADDPALIERLRRGVTDPKRLDDHADELRTLYRGVA